MPMKKTIWIIGAGKFGLRAFTKLSATHKNWDFVLVDPLEDNLNKAGHSKCILSKSDGVDFLDHQLIEGNSLPDWIIPALPVHLAAEWCLLRCVSGLTRAKIPSEVDSMLPNAMRGTDGNVYVSNADFLCPTNCNEPDDFCTVTKKPRQMDMYKRLEVLNFRDFHSVVIQSHQLGPGIGGYTPAQLFRLLDSVNQLSVPVFLCTACRCHGVITGFQTHHGG